MPTWSLRWPQRLQPALLGIDLGADQIRLLACSRQNDSWRVEQCATAPSEAGLLEGRVQQFEQAALSLSRLVTSVGSGRRIALALPPVPAWREVLDVPARLRPWAARRWLRERAEQLSGLPFSALSWAAEVRPGRPARLLLSVRPLELVQDWQGLAEAAGLELVLLDDRQRVMHLALRVLGLGAVQEPVCLAEAGEQVCVLHRWRLGQWPEQWSWAADQALEEVFEGEGSSGLSGLCASQVHAWVCGPPSACAYWAARLEQEGGGRWPVLDPLAGLGWRDGLARPGDAGTFLAALGLALRAWYP